MREIITQRHLQSQHKTDYIPKDVEEISQIDYIKKKHAQKAIRWLLSKAPHSVDEIADHFGISPELAKGFLMDLTEDNLIVKLPGHSTKYSLEPVNTDGEYMRI